MSDLAKLTYDTLSFSDGTTLKVAKQPALGFQDWQETKNYLEANPEEAKRLVLESKDFNVTRELMQAEVLMDYYEGRKAYGDETVCNKLMALEKHPDFAHVIAAIKTGGMPAAMQYYYNEPLMTKLSKAMGGIPEDVKDKVTDLQKSPVTVHEACKMGDTKALTAFLDSPGDFDTEDADSKGVTCLGYAVGANRPEIVKLLLGRKANVNVVDASGNSALHVAAAYGRTEMVKWLAASSSVNATNKSGQTPLALALKNKMTEAADALTAKGARA